MIAQNIAHLGHVELLTNRFEQSLDFFTRVYGLSESTRDNKSAYLRAYDDYEFCTLKLTESETTGVGHISYRAISEKALNLQAEIIANAGYELKLVDGDLSHGKAYQFKNFDGHLFEIYWHTNWYQADKEDQPALKNISQKYHGRGCCPRRIDHLNLLSSDVNKFRDFIITCLGSMVTEQMVLNNGDLAGCWFTVNNKTYDLACTKDLTGSKGRLHHITYATDQREDILKAADIFLENKVYIETGPHKHAIQGTFFLYVWEPAGNRVELANAGARLLLAPDWKTINWTESDRQKGQAWGLKTIESFQTHGTPPVTCK